MRLIALHNDKKVIICTFILEGENLKAVYVDSEGEIDIDNVENFVAESHEVLSIQ